MSDTVPAFEIEQQLARILRSDRLIRARSQADLFAFLVSQKLKNTIPTEWEIAREVFNRGEGWKADEDSIVRVTCTRLTVNLDE